MYELASRAKQAPTAVPPVPARSARPASGPGAHPQQVRFWQRPAGHDASAARPRSSAGYFGVQPGPAASDPGGACEREADRVAEQVTSAPRPDGAGAPAPPPAREASSPRGQPLDAATRGFMEPRFGEDFGGVRVHAGGEAAAAARAIGARAYTLGSDVVFAGGEYAPHTDGGRRLLAHELVHVLQQRGGPPLVQRQPDLSPRAAAWKRAAELETEILSHPVHGKLDWASRERVKVIVAFAATRPLGDAKGQRLYYLEKLKLAITTPFEGQDPGKGDYACTRENEERNRKQVEEALEIEKRMMGAFSDLDEEAVAEGADKSVRVGQGRKTFRVDRTDPRNIRVQMKVKLDGDAREVEQIKRLEDAIEAEAHTEGYWLDIVFVDTAGPDVFEFTVRFCEWANSGNWASGPRALAHEAHHALGLPDRYDDIEKHAGNRLWAPSTRLFWFVEQLGRKEDPRGAHSKMGSSGKPLLSEDVCAVAWEPGVKRNECIQARKDLDPAGIPPH